MKLAILLLSLTTFASAQQPADTTHPARISGGVMAGQILTKVAPVYPPEAKTQRISGMVVLHAIIARDGTIQNLTVVSGPDLLAESAITAVSQWTYKPYLLNGEPTEVDTTITVNFNMGPTPAPTQQPPSLSAEGRPLLTPADLKGSLVSKVPPAYPAAAKSAHISGSVVLRAVIDEEGRVASLQVVSGPPELTDAAMTAVYQWRYKPFQHNGVAIQVETEIIVNFAFG